MLSAKLCSSVESVAGASGFAGGLPALVFVLGLLWFHEPLHPAQLGCFVLIWCAMALFVWDLLRGRRAAASRA